ncbi:unnamed protein product [Calypogeia fissa]
MHNFTNGGNCRWKRSAAALVCILLLQAWSGGGFMQLIKPVSGQGSWALLLENAGIASMHTAVTHYGTAVFLDRTDIGLSQINLPNGVCRNDPNDITLKHDCSAHSVEFYPATNTVRPLLILTDTWCSSGQFDANGVLVQTGGDMDGLHKIRRFAPCPQSVGTCDWVEDETANLTEPRWYATNQLLPDGLSQIVVGGRFARNYEFVPAAPGGGYTMLDLLVQTTDSEFDNLYPYVHLLPSGLLFIFAYNQSIVYDYTTQTTVATMPILPGGPRNYPSAGSSVMLPLQSADGYTSAEIVVCGGAELGAYLNPTAQFPATDSCGRIVVTDPIPTWALETMPTPRLMGDMLLLPDLTTLIINGAQKGSQGWGEASDPCLSPWNYDPNAVAGSRFSIWSATTIPRVYHSTANLLPDGRILIAGSNSHQFYTFTGPFPTELRVEAFSPPYLDVANDANRPTITIAPTTLSYGSAFSVIFTLPTPPAGIVNLVMNSAPFSTHSFSQGQRQLVLANAGPPVPLLGNSYNITGTAPPTGEVAPAAYYMLFVVNGGIPSTAAWVQMTR